MRVSLNKQVSRSEILSRSVISELFQIMCTLFLSSVKLSKFCDWLTDWLAECILIESLYVRQHVVLSTY